ncbi:MAG TPA: GGDEF domain-containing protein [Candidatus Limnocylindrales bacterium]|nr:GGDEF domain-containing protein [Candidatus Limnocylindrales bacterium]
MDHTQRSTTRIPLWLGFLAAGAVLLGLHVSLETSSLPQRLLYDIVGGSAIVAAVVGVARHRPERVAPWLLMAFGQALFVAGDLMWNYFELVGEDPFPSVADVLYLAGYPFLALGLFLMIRRRTAGGDRGGLIDAAILTTAVGILSWTFLMQPQVVGADIDPVSMAISLAYPITDVLLVGVAMGLLTTPGARTVSFRLLATSLLLLVVADTIYALQTFDGTYVSGGTLDLAYLVSYLLFGASALHPSMRRLTDPHPVVVTWLGTVRLTSLAAAMVTGPILVTLGPGADGSLVVVAAGTAVLSLLVLMRLAGLVGLLERDVAARRVLEARLTYQAYHDPLTELANRRRFVEATTTALSRRAAPGSLAVLFLDLDDFKTVNDGLGHAAGDELLAAVADRIRTGVRETDVAARLGGDEFGVLLVDVPGSDYAIDAAARLLDALQAPIQVVGQSITAGASIGVAVDTAQTKGVDDLLGQADIAMYRAKAQGKGRYHLFTGADVLDDQAAVGRVSEATGRAVRRGLSFRKPGVTKPQVGRAAFGQEPG